MDVDISFSHPDERFLQYISYMTCICLVDNKNAVFRQKVQKDVSQLILPLENFDAGFKLMLCINGMEFELTDNITLTDTLYNNNQLKQVRAKHIAQTCKIDMVGNNKLKGDLDVANGVAKLTVK